MTLIFLFLISLLVLEIHNEMMEEERKYLYNKVIKRINILDTFTPLKNIYFRNANQTIQYNPNKIKQILDKYKFPEQYNFIEQEKPDVHIKDQERCSSCWAFASSTAFTDTKYTFAPFLTHTAAFSLIYFEYVSAFALYA